MLGMPGEVLFVSCFLVVGIYLYRFNREILSTDYVLLVAT